MLELHSGLGELESAALLWDFEWMDDEQIRQKATVVSGGKMEVPQER